LKRKGARKKGDHPLKGRKRTPESLRKFRETMAQNRLKREAARSGQVSGPPAVAATASTPAAVELKGPAAIAARAAARRREVLLGLLANVGNEFKKAEIVRQVAAKSLTEFVMNRAFDDAVRDGTLRRLSKGRYQKAAGQTVTTTPAADTSASEPRGLETEARTKLAFKDLQKARENIKARMSSGRLSDEDRAHHLDGLAFEELRIHGTARAADAVRFLLLGRRAIAEDRQAGRLHEDDAAHALGLVALKRLQGEIV
jgi:hypothetical protein